MTGATRTGGRRELLGWTLALVLLRAACVVTLGDVFFYGEELEKGVAGKAMIDGIDVAHHKLAYHYFEGGGFVVSHLKALSFLLLGESVLANKLVFLAGIPVFLVFWRLLDHHYGRTAARVGALLFLLGPESFQRNSLLSLGAHYEPAACGLFVLDEGLRLFADPARRPSRRWVFLVGAVAGFGIFVGFSNALAVGWVGLLLLARRPRFLLSGDGLTALGGFVVGLAPLLAMTALVGSQVVDVHGTAIEAPEGSRLAGYLASIYGGRSPEELLRVIVYPAAALMGTGLALALLPSRARLAAAGHLGFVLLWLGVWFLGPFLPGKHVHWSAWLRLTPVALGALALTSAGLAAALGRGGGARRVARGLAALLILLGATGAGRILTEGRPASPLRNLRVLASTKGYDYRGYFGEFLPHLEALDAEHARPLLAFDEPHPELLHADLAARLFDGRRLQLSLHEQFAELDRLDPELRMEFARGMGLSVTARTGGDLRQALLSVDGLPEPMRSTLAEAVGYFGAHYGSRLETVLADVRIGLEAPDGLRAPFLRGVGARAFRSLVVSPYGGELALDDRAVRALLAERSTEAVPHLLAGFDRERVLWTLP